MSEEVTAIIRNVRFGVSDRGWVALQFDTYTSENTAALQVLSVEQAVKAIEDAGVTDVHRLNGMACWVEQGGGLMKFKKMWKK